MSGTVSAIADDLVLSDVVLMFAGLASLLAFLCGAAYMVALVNQGRRRSMQSEFALPFMLEAALLLLFGLTGMTLGQYRVVFALAIVVLLRFLMGLQSVITTKVSRTEIRTTYVTSLATDIDIEIGEALYWNHGHHNLSAVVTNQPKLRLLASLLGMFSVSGVVGALGFKHLDYAAMISLVSILTLLAVVSVVDDLLVRRR